MSKSNAMTETLLQYELHIEMMRTRMLQAREAAQRAIRFSLTKDSTIICVFAGDLDRVVEILEGKQ